MAVNATTVLVIIQNHVGKINHKNHHETRRDSAIIERKRVRIRLQTSAAISTERTTIVNGVELRKSRLNVKQQLEHRIGNSFFTKNILNYHMVWKSI
jgi:hypothetical protein